MGKTGKWIKNFLTGKKDKNPSTTAQKLPPIATHPNPTTPISVPPTTPKEKRRWSFRRSSASTPTGNFENSMPTTPPSAFEAESYEQKKHAMAVAMTTAAAADAAVAAAQAAAAMMRLTAATTNGFNAMEEAAATKIQSVFRSYLARKALCALKGLVKLQALVRGHLVRKQAKATLRCMQALVMVQARARAQRIRGNDQTNTYDAQRPSSAYRSRPTQDLLEENIKIVEMDVGRSKSSTKGGRNSYSRHQQQTEHEHEHRASTHVSPAPSVLTELSPRASSGHFEDFSFGTAQSCPQYFSKPDTYTNYSKPSDYAESLCYEFPTCPSYMANTESSRAKVRSHSAPKQRPADHNSVYERQFSGNARRRPSIEGRNVPRAVKMQRSSSHVGSTAQNYHYPWSVKLDRSSVSLIESECGSTSTVLTNANYCKSLVGFDVHENRYRAGS